ncbi:hypothetical protein HYDPIDRAFT_190777 [Hydnomerulius pinastri MD-312]|uniref:Uncharacterized protein n=1 Tax=Hydnomerulius pinastri MD-312 TaxID=994086 RepID=A0A0C9V001_9AGAM|nr:hypothetical protein HYDPIDRAFT_190777 [Hydnomerulius pinastri MD-312]
MTLSNYNAEQLVSALHTQRDAANALDEALDKAKRTAEKLTNDYGSKFTVVKELKSPVAKIAEEYAKELRASRDVANSDIATRLSQLRDVYLPITETVDSMSSRDEAVEALQSYKSEVNPLAKSPLKGFPAVTEVFSNVWSYTTDITSYCNTALKNATPLTINQVVEKLKSDLVPVKTDLKTVQDAVESYANTRS